MKTNHEKEKTFTRTEFYDLVWSKPITKIIQDIPLTHTAFKKLCLENDIPLPKNGYWQKLKYNKKIKKTPLIETGKTYAKICLSNNKSIQGVSELAALTNEITNDENLQLKTPKNLIKPEKIIVSTRDYLQKLKKVEYSSQLEIPKDGLVSVSVTDKLTERTLILADTFIKNLKSRGHDVVVVKDHMYSNYNGTRYIIFGEYFEIRIRETNNRVMEKHPRYDWNEAKYFPTGKLSLKVDSYPCCEWQDSKTKLLEDKLPNIIAYLELSARDKIIERVNSKSRIAKNNERKRIEAEITKNREKEISDFKSLINSSGRWYKSQSLRNYLDTFENNAKKNNSLDEKKVEWLKWARKKADWYDPFIESEDETFKDIDRDSF